LDFGPQNGYAINSGNDLLWGVIPVGPWRAATPAQNQQLIDLWNKLEQDRKAGKIPSWAPWNHCDVPIIKYSDYGLPPTPPPPKEPYGTRDPHNGDHWWWATGGAGGF
jgi:hypothetical protein